MRRADLESASGLRPLSAFVVISAVVLAVVVRVGWLALVEDVLAREPSVARETGVTPSYSILDRDGVPLAAYIDRLDLVMSPNAMWQAHTPRRMARRIGEVLDVQEEELLERMLPDARGGVVTVLEWPLDEDAAARVNAWIVGEEPWEREAREPVPGIGLRPLRTGGYLLEWVPSVVLDGATREEHGAGRSPVRWTQHIADALGSAVLGELPREAGDEGRRRRRDAVWAALLPSRWTTVFRGVPPELAKPLADVLVEELVARHQMRLDSSRTRLYPAGEFPILGQWGFVEEGQTEPIAYSGLERLADGLLTSDEWSFIECYPSTYSYRRDNPAREPLQPYFLSRSEPSPTPEVRVTLDIELQRTLRDRLELAMEEHEPSTALAIVVEVESGDVLAVDGIHRYPIAGLAPVKHLFMPGSTFKIVTMASALEAGVVHPRDTFEVGNGKWVLRVDGGTRVISEAEGSRRGLITAEEALAYSVNAGLVQIGLRIPAERFHGDLLALGYSRRPSSGLGGEEPGRIPEMPWDARFKHASVCYGYEILTSLWQHMQALTTVLRGGEFRELRLARSVEHDGRAFELARDVPTRVFSRGTCDTVRGMMATGAEVGTGRDFWREDIVMGTKTGTAERVRTEVCAHEYGRKVAALVEAGEPVLKRHRRELRGVRTIHSSCYTSSMVAYGRLPGDDREVAVLVVMEEPTGEEHFGSKVAGPVAMDLLLEALRVTKHGDPATPDYLPGFVLADEREPSVIGAEREQPWSRDAAERERSAW